jgi:cell division protein FtsZ
MADENIETGLEFDLPKNRSSVIKVIGVGGGGSNAVNHMQLMGIKGVDFMVCNTDAQALEYSPVKNRIQLGVTLTEGLGAGANPDVGRQAAEESRDEVLEVLKHNTKMVFITAGMGGGTGTGAAPVIARFAREMNILTVGIVTHPFKFEGKIRAKQAQDGIDELRQHVDSLIVINNDKLREVYGNLSFRSGFAKADEVLATAAKGIAEVITYHYTTNIDLRDVRTVLENSGTAIMGSAQAGGADRANNAVKQALDSPLLNDNHIQGSKNVLLLIVSNGNEHEITMDEMGLINDYIQDEAGGDTNVIMGIGIDDELEEDIAVTIIATGFPANQHELLTGRQPEKIVHPLEEDQPISKSIFERPFADVGNPDKPLKQKPDPQPDLFSAAAKSTAVVHDLYEEEPQAEEAANVTTEETTAVEQPAAPDELDNEMTLAADEEGTAAVDREMETEPELEVNTEADEPVFGEESESAEAEMLVEDRAIGMADEAIDPHGEGQEVETISEDSDNAVLIEEENDITISLNLSAEVDAPVLEVETMDETASAIEYTGEEDEMTFELDDIDGDGIYLQRHEEAEHVEEPKARETEYAPFDLRIDDAMGENSRVNEGEKRLDLITSEDEAAKPEKVVHTLDDLRELEQKLQIKSVVGEENSAEPQFHQQTPVEEDEALQFEVKVKEEPAGDRQDLTREDDFLNKPISAAMRQQILERKKRLEEFNYTFKHATTELLEKEPAYKRQGLDLGSEDHSGKNEVSRLTLSGDDAETQIKTNNSFLHDNVD